MGIVPNNIVDIVPVNGQEDIYINEEYEPIFDYDTPEEIDRCLNCEKEDCDNCLKTINGV